MAYNPSEPRDPLGKWMKAHGGNPKASLADNVKSLNYAEEHGAAVDTKNTPTAVIDQIAKTGKDEDNRLEALMNPNIGDETLDSFKYSDDVRERTAVASNPKLDGKTLDMMADDDNFYVKRAVALNRNTPTNTLERLEGDADKDIADYALMAWCRNRSLEYCKEGDYGNPSVLLGQNRYHQTLRLEELMDYDDVRDPMPLPGQDGYNDYIETNEKLHVCDAYTSEIATEAARNGDYDAALQIFEAGHSEWTDDRAGNTFPLSKGRMECPAMAIDAETKLADQFLYHASSEQCEKLYELGYDSSAQGILNRFDMTNTISTRPMAEHCTVPDRLDRLSQSKDSETRLHVAGNPNTSLHTLETLSEDKDEKVSRRAVMNLEHCRENQRLSDEYAGVDFNDDSGYDDIQFEY